MISFAIKRPNTTDPIPPKSNINSDVAIFPYPDEGEIVNTDRVIR